MSKTILLQIQPNVLKWAREEAGYDVSEVARKLKIHEDEYNMWEDAGKEITKTQLDSLCTLLKRQTAFFFLPDPPPKSKKPHDFRRQKEDRSKLDSETTFAIRQANYFQSIALELQGSSFWIEKSGKVPKLLTESQENKIAQLRNIIGISLEVQKKFVSYPDAFRQWRNAIEEKLGVLIFQFGFPIEDAQGFCLSDTQPFVIVVNSNFAHANRIFTIFHELAHLLLNHSGLCGWSEYDQNEEYECNDFAGRFLIPEVFSCSSIHEIENAANKYKVSKEVYLRRLHAEEAVSRDQFFEYLEIIRREGLQKAKLSKKGFALPEVKSKSNRGDTFYNLVLSALHNQQINYSQASRYLDVSLGRLDYGF